MKNHYPHLGEDNDFSKAVCLNAAAGLMISEKYDDFKIAYNYTRGFIKSGAAFKYIKSLQNVWKYPSENNWSKEN